MSPKPNSFQGVSPVILSAGVSLLQSNSANPDSGLLSYPFRKAIIIEEIRWTIRSTIEADTTSNLVNLGALVSTKIQFGSKYLMRDAVPIWLLGTFMSQPVEEHLDNWADDVVNYSNYRWRLPEPLYLEAGEVLRSTFFRGADGLSPFNVEVTYVGRTVAPKQARPGVIAIPYVAPFVTTIGQQTFQQSNENHLFNPFDVPLRIQRLTGRVLTVEGVVAAYSTIKMTPSTPGASMTVLMNDSWGGKMINNNTGPSDVFDILRAAWTFDTIMPPKGVYEIKAWNIGSGQSLHVAMIGTREERL